MTANTMNQQRLAQPSSAVPAWCTIAGGVLTFILGVPLARFQTETPLPWWIPALNAVSHLLLLVGVVELGRARVAGRGGLATSGWWLTLLGLVVLTVAEGVSLLNMNVAIVFYSVATLILILGPILLGIAVVRAGRWMGWHRFTPLITGLFMMLVVLPALFLPGHVSNNAIGGWGLCWLLLGVSQLAEA
jgi:hypothetical protein